MSHYYTPTGEPMHFAAPGGRPTGPATARKLGLLPSVTTVLNDVLRKPGLERWIIQQNLLAVLTAPDVPGEAIDAKVTRVLETERQQEQEAKLASDRGTQIHTALEEWFKDVFPSEEMEPWISPAAEAIEKYGKVHACEKILVGEGYAGKCDLIQEAHDCWWIWDWKTTKKLPKDGAWNEHLCQNSAYCKAWQQSFMWAMPIRTGNVYISTVEQGAFVIHEHDDWRPVYSNGFLPLLTVWKWMNNL